MSKSCPKPRPSDDSTLSYVYTVRWTQDNFSGVSADRHIRFGSLKECVDYCHKVNSLYREIHQWPVGAWAKDNGRGNIIDDSATDLKDSMEE